MKVHYVVRLALEWFRASGERTRARLDALVAHFADAYGEPSVKSLQDEAWEEYTRAVQAM